MIRRKECLWQAVGGSLVLLGAVLGSSHALAAPRPVAAKRCGPGRYVVKGRALLKAGAPNGEDAVTLRVPGEAEEAPPTIAVASGCPEAPVTLEPKKGGTRVRARLSGCTSVAGEIAFRGRIDASCRIMRGQLQVRRVVRTAGKRGAVRRRFKAELNGGFMGSVLGGVSARHGTASFPLQDMQVFLVKRSKRTPSVPSVQSDDRGRFTLAGKTGEYDVCASGGAFPLTCNPEPVRFGPYLPDDAMLRDIEIPVAGSAVHGRVLLADGSPCYHAANPLDGGVVARVSRDATSVTADSSASYLLPDVPGPGSYTLRATCGAAQVEQAVAVGPEELAGTRGLELTIPNTPPEIGLLSASQNGQGVQKPPAGATVDVAADVVDPDGDALHYAWIDDNGGVTPVDAPAARWTMQSVPAQNTLNLLVADGKGGYATRQLVLRAGVPFTRFTGTVKEPDGTPLANATVTVGDQVTQTDESGHFRLKVADAPDHVLSVKAPGHAPYAKPFDGDAAGLDIMLGAARQFTVDAGADIDVMDGPDGSTLRVRAGALVDAAGNPATGPLTVEVYTYDGTKGEFPGDGLGERDGQLAGMQLQTCLWLAVTDASGRRFNLAPGQRAELSFKMPATVLKDPPATIALVRFDDAAGRWVEDGIARLHGDRYVAQVTHLGSAGITFFNGGACLRIEADDNSLERPFWLRITDPTNNTSGTVFVTQKLTPFFGLRANTFHRVEVMPKSNPSRVIQMPMVKTAGNVSGPFKPPFPYSTCKGVALKAKLPSKSWLTRKGFGSEQSAQDYYKQIGATPAKDTFAKWLAANGFAQGFRANDVVFFNPNELGLGRRVNCTMTSGGQPTVACYNTKFGEVGGNVDEMLHDTADLIAPGDSVAMEFSPGGLRPDRNVKYFIYGPDGKLKTKTAFDTEGYVKYVPNVCNHCHNGGIWDGLGRFVALDPHEYQYQSSGPYTLENQQERFRQLNEMISYALRHTGPAWDLIDSIYPGSPGVPLGVHAPGTKARPAPVPEGWRSAPDIYTKIVKPACRTCHMNQSSVLDFAGLNDHAFLALGALYAVGGDRNDMPNAMAPALRLWRSTDPFLPDVFYNFINGDFCGGENFPCNGHPTIAIITPTENGQLHYGGKNGVHFSAQASDPEDGTNVSVKWLDEAGTVIGTGPTFDKVYPAPGVQRVRAIATDSFGTPSVAGEVTFVLTNTAPTLTVSKPFVGQKLVTDTNHQFEAYTFDPNEPFLEVPCNRIEWRSSAPSDAPITVGCKPVFHFFEPGTRTLTVKATDTQGASVTRTRTVNVELKVTAPPQVTVSSPTSGQTFGVDESVPLAAAVTDPAGGQPVAQWSVFLPDLTELPIGAGNTLSWTPSATLGPVCQTVDVTLRAHVEAPFRGGDDAFAKIIIKGPGCQTPQVIITSPMEGDREFFVTEQIPLAADVIDPTAPPPASDGAGTDASDTVGGKLAVRWSVKNADDGTPEIFLGEGNPLLWTPSATLSPGCRASLYILIARASNAAGETTAFRQVTVGDFGHNCD